MDSLSSLVINKSCEYLPAYMGEADFEAIEDLLKIYNPFTGPVQKVVTHYGMNGGSPCYVGHSDCFNLDYIMKKMSGTGYVDFGLKKTLHAGGKGVGLDDMFLGSLGEAAERAIGGFSFFSKKDEIVYGSYTVLMNRGLHCLHPDELFLFADEQYKSGIPFSRFTEDSYLGWVKGNRLISGNEIYVPAQMVMIVYPNDTNEKLIGYATSGGMATHRNWETAVYRGVCELIERDAINLRWVCGIPPEKIDVLRESLRSSSLKELLFVFDKLPMRLKYYYQNMDIKEVSVITVVAIQEWFKKYAFLAGGGAEIDFEETLERAISEFVQSERSLNAALLCPARAHGVTIDRMFGVNEDAPESKLDVFFKIIVYYGYKKNIKKLDWYLSGKNTLSSAKISSKNIGGAKERYNFIINVLKKHCLDPICFDLTPPYFNRLKLVKIFVPELTQPFVASLPYLGHGRYYNLPQKLGFTDRNLTFKDLVKLPLPYP